jgi:hypothetical protein
MTEHNRLLTRGWLLPFLVTAFVALHLFLLHMFWHGNLSHRLIPGALVSVVFLLAVAKHVDLLAVQRFLNGQLLTGVAQPDAPSESPNF